MSDVKTVDCQEFARLMGLGPRKFMDALRAGTVPMPLNPVAQKITQYRWASGAVSAFLTGAYKGPMMPGEKVPGPRPQAGQAAATTAPVKRGRPKVVKNVEPAGAAPEGRMPITLPAIVPGETTEFVIKIHTDGTMSLGPSRLKS
jgi:hypothetical protein